MDLPSGWAETASNDLVEHLRSRTMAGLPHIGILGPRPLDTVSVAAKKGVQKTDEPSVIEEDEYTMQSGSDDDDPNYPDWKFVPNKMVYHLTVTPSSDDPFITEVSFYIRIDDGCDGDTGVDLGDRPEKYILTKEALMSVFRHYRITISCDPSFILQPNIRVDVDGKPLTLAPDQLRLKISDDAQSVDLTLKDESRVFLTFVKGKQELVIQKYVVNIRKDVRRENGKVTINVELRNVSPRTQRSVISNLAIDKDTGAVKSEEETLEKLAETVGEEPLFTAYRPTLFKTPHRTNNPEGNKYGYLMELEASEKVHSSTKPYDHYDAAQTINAVMDDGLLLRKDGVYTGKIVFKDHAVFQEEVPFMASGSPPDDLVLQLGMDQDLGLVLKEDMGFEHLYRFQEVSVRRIVEGLRHKKVNSTFLLSARTAGGKTEAFLIPIAELCLADDSLGVKALVFYPTKALANDQTNRYIEMLYYLNKRIASKRRKVTLGLLHGDISQKEPDEGSLEEWDLPLACPKCKKGTLKNIEKGLTCDSCAEVLDFVRVANRQLVYANPPDILITNPDTIVWALMLRPENHAIFGRPIVVCKACHETYTPKGIKKKCDNEKCRSTSLDEIQPTAPKVIVFDEVHMFRGTFGINCSYFISRLEGIIRKYSSEYLNDLEPVIMKIGSTATISNPEKFARDFFNCKPEDLVLVPRDDDERKSFYVQGMKDNDVKRHHVYIMPYAYNTDSTIGKAIHYLQARSRLGKPPTRLDDQREAWGGYLQTICFVNSIRSSNNLISLTARTVVEELHDLEVNGHTTDFDRKQRGNMERMFNNQKLHVIFATQTLEVGIDFRRVEVVMINGFPFSFNDYLQRIGRGGRKMDSLVVTVCQNWKPIDHYYYSNAKEALKNPSLHIEPVPITRNNLEAVKKHARGAVFDFLMSNADAKDYVDDVRKLKSIGGRYDSILHYCFDSLKPNEGFKEELSNAIKEFLDYIQNVAANEINSKALVKKFKETINERFQLTSLRSTDREVLVEVVWAR